MCREGPALKRYSRYGKDSRPNEPSGFARSGALRLRQRDVRLTHLFDHLRRLFLAPKSTLLDLRSSARNGITSNLITLPPALMRFAQANRWLRSKAGSIVLLRPAEAG
jgi:hypothetical protein